MTDHHYRERARFAIISPLWAGMGRLEGIGTIPPHPMLEGYEASLVAAGLAAKTRDVYLQSARAYTAAVDPLTATPRDVEAYLASLGVGKNSLAQYQARLKRLHAYLVRDGLRPDNPLDLLDRPKIPQGRPRPLPDHYLHAIWDLATPVERAWIVLGLYCGLRAGEAVAVSVEDIEGDELVVRGKGDKERRVPIRGEVFDALEAVGWPKSGRFFPDAGEKAASVAIGKLLRTVGAPTPRFSYHSLRHRAGSEWYRASRDVKVVAEMMGHSSIQTTLVYAEADLDHAKWVAGRMPTIVGRAGESDVQEEDQRAGSGDDARRLRPSPRRSVA